MPVAFTATAIAVMVAAALKLCREHRGNQHQHAPRVNPRRVPKRLDKRGRVHLPKLAATPKQDNTADDSFMNQAHAGGAPLLEQEYTFGDEVWRVAVEAIPDSKNGAIATATDPPKPVQYACANGARCWSQDFVQSSAHFRMHFVHVNYREREPISAELLVRADDGASGTDHGSTDNHEGHTAVAAAAEGALMINDKRPNTIRHPKKLVRLPHAPPRPVGPGQWRISSTENILESLLRAYLAGSDHAMNLPVFDG